MALQLPNWKNFIVTLLMILLVSIVVLWLISKFFIGDKFTVPSDSDKVILTAIKIVIVAIAIFLAYAFVIKVTGDGFSKRDAVTLIVLAIGLWYLWDNVLVGIFTAPDLDHIAIGVKAAGIGIKTALVGP